MPYTDSFGNTISNAPAGYTPPPQDSFYKYDDHPTVFRGSDNYAFTSEQDFTSKGGSFNNIEVRKRPVSVISSNPAKQATLNANQTITRTEQGAGTAGSTSNRISDQIKTLVEGIQGAGGSLSAGEQQLYDSLSKMSGDELATSLAGRTALDTADARAAVNAANELDEIQTTRSTMLKDLLGSLTTRQNDIQTISKLFETTPEEQDLGKSVRDKTSKLRGYDVDTMKGQAGIADQSIPTVIAGRQEQQFLRQRTFQRLGLSNELMAYADLLDSYTSSRSQKLEAAKFMFNANAQTLSDSLAIYKELAPTNVATHIDDETGNMKVIMRNPITGENVTQNLGQVGTPKAWIRNVEFAQAAGVGKPFYKKAGSPTVINSQNGRAYETWEQFLADGGRPELIQEVSPMLYDKSNVFGSAEGGFYYLNPNGKVTQITAPQPKIDPTLGGLTKEQISILKSVQDDVRVDPDVKGFIEVRDGYERVQTGAIQNNAQGDLALLFGFMKMLDPNSVVRETEFANAEQAQGTLQRFFNIPSKFIKGTRLTEEGRQYFASAARDLYQRKQQSHERAIDFYGAQLEQFGIPRDLGLRDFGSTFEDEAPSVTGVNGNAVFFSDGTTSTFPSQSELRQFLDSYDGVSGGPQSSAPSNKKFASADPTFGSGSSKTASTIAYQKDSDNTLTFVAIKPQNVINGFDLTSYATDPTHERKVRGIYNSIPVTTVLNPVSVDIWIQQKAKGSPVKGKDVLDAAKAFNVDPNLILAIMVQDSSLGTAGKAVRTKNPGNVGNTDSGATRGFATWRDGVFAVARNLSKRRVVPAAPKAQVPNTYA